MFVSRNSFARPTPPARLFSLLLFSLLLSSLLSPSPTSAALEQAKKSDAFIDSIGVNTHYGNAIFIGGNAYANPAIDAKLGNLGIRHLRDHTYNDTGLARIDSLFATYGIQTTLILGETTRTPADLVTLLKYHPAYTGIEGLNEPDFNPRSWNGFTDVPANNDYSGTRAFQNDLYAAVKADPLTQSRLILSPAMGDTAKTQFLGAINYDVAAMHSYPVAREPTFNLDTHKSRLDAFRDLNKPLMSTETGYYNQPAPDTGSIPENVAGKYMLRLYGEYFNRNIARTYLYELADQGSDTTEREQNFGLLRFDMTEKPAYTATKNLIDLLKEPSAPAFDPSQLDYTLTSSSSLSTVHRTLLQKSDGRFYLLLWNEVAGYNRFSETELTVAPIPATLTFGSSWAEIKTYLPNDSASAAATLLNTNTLNLNILDKLTIVELNPVPEPEVGMVVLGAMLLGRRRVRRVRVTGGRAKSQSRFGF